MPVTNLLSLSSKSTLHCLLYENRDGPCNISALQLAQCLAMMEKGAGGMLKKEGLSFLVSEFTPPSCSCFTAASSTCGYTQECCGAQLHPVGRFPSNFRSTLMVGFPSSLGITMLDFQFWHPAPR